jgi:hypothetical protein
MGERPVDGGLGWQVDAPASAAGLVPLVPLVPLEALAHPRPPRQSALVAHAPPTFPVPSGWHSAENPTRSQRSPPMHAASLAQVDPATPVPADRHVREAPQ